MVVWPSSWPEVAYSRAQSCLLLKLSHSGLSSCALEWRSARLLPRVHTRRLGFGGAGMCDQKKHRYTRRQRKQAVGTYAGIIVHVVTGPELRSKLDFCPRVCGVLQSRLKGRDRQCWRRFRRGHVLGRWRLPFPVRQSVGTGEGGRGIMSRFQRGVASL